MGISDQSIRLTLRLPEKLRDKLGQQAIKNHRSLNSEIVSLLNNNAVLKSNSVNEDKALYKASNTELEVIFQRLSKQEKDAFAQLVELLKGER